MQTLIKISPLTDYALWLLCFIYEEQNWDINRNAQREDHFCTYIHRRTRREDSGDFFSV